MILIEIQYKTFLEIDGRDENILDEIKKIKGEIEKKYPGLKINVYQTRGQDEYC